MARFKLVSTFIPLHCLRQSGITVLCMSCFVLLWCWSTYGHQHDFNVPVYNAVLKDQLQSVLLCEGFLSFMEDPWVTLSWHFSFRWGCCLFWHIHHISHVLPINALTQMFTNILKIGLYTLFVHVISAIVQYRQKIQKFQKDIYRT